MLLILLIKKRLSVGEFETVGLLETGISLNFLRSKSHTDLRYSPPCRCYRIEQGGGAQPETCIQPIHVSPAYRDDSLSNARKQRW